MSVPTALPATLPPPVAGAERFAAELVRLLRRYGAPAHRLELAMASFAAGLGVVAAWHVLPTSILSSSGAGRVTLVDVAQEDTDLQRLVAVDEVAQAVAARRLDPDAGVRALAAIEAAPSRVGVALDAAGWAAGSGSAALFFGGGWREALVAAGVGLLGFGVSKVGRFASNALVEVVTAAAAAALVHAAPGVAAEPVLLGGLVALYPGLRLTTGLTDLATGHLVSGSGGLLSAGVTLLQLGFGVAVGTQLGVAWFGPPTPVTATVMPFAELAGLGVGALAFAVFLRARVVPRAADRPRLRGRVLRGAVGQRAAVPRARRGLRRAAADRHQQRARARPRPAGGGDPGPRDLAAGAGVAGVPRGAGAARAGRRARRGRRVLDRAVGDGAGGRNAARQRAGPPAPDVVTPGLRIHGRSCLAARYRVPGGTR
jgi:uncharacterized membrane protein YjjP (DUF1212 family)